MTTTPPDNSEWIDELRVQVTVPVEGVQTDGTQMVKNYTLPLTAEAKAQIIAKLREAETRGRVAEDTYWLAGERRVFFWQENIVNHRVLISREDIRARLYELNSPQGEEAGTV